MKWSEMGLAWRYFCNIRGRLRVNGPDMQNLAHKAPTWRGFMGKPALLMLDDGTCFEGDARGAIGETSGEVVFTTGMAGYQETLTDPSFFGQIITFTSAHIGNYGISPLDDEAPRTRASGAVFHDLFEGASGKAFPHWRAVESVDERLRREGVTAIAGVDTRALTLHLREHGARGGIISSVDLDRPSLLRKAKALSPMAGQDLALKASCDKQYEFSLPADEARPAPHNPPMHIAVMDFGMKRSIAANMARLGIRVTVWPANAQASDILAQKPDGVLLSNGPGDPEPCTYAIKTLRELVGRVPLFGICLGHQILALALGAKTYKLPFGHHGANHPVQDVATGRVHITSQNHGFNVDPDSLPKNLTPTHWNLNDQTLEGLAVTDAPAFSVQFHPEAAPGPTDARMLFQRFRDCIFQFKGGKAHA